MCIWMEEKKSEYIKVYFFIYFFISLLNFFFLYIKKGSYKL